MSDSAGIRAIDTHSVHRITSGQVVIDLQTAVKELVENSLDAGATNIDVRFQNYGLKSIEVIDNGTGISPRDYDSIALKHHTSKLSSFDDLSRVLTFGFRGEALSSLSALSDGLTITTATAAEAPMGTILDIDRNGRVKSKSGKIARQKGTTVALSNLFKPLPVRRKELERNIKREFQKALHMLYAYALVPCSKENKGVRLTVTNQTEGGRKSIQLKTDGMPSVRSSVQALWGARSLDNIVDLDLSFDVETEKAVLRRQSKDNPDQEMSTVTPVRVQGLISRFTVSAGRTAGDRQYFFVNGRPFNPGKVQKAFNEVYRTFNANQLPVIVADFVLPTHACDVNVSPDKRTIFLHSENNLVQALKESLEKTFSSSRSTYDVTVTSHPPTSTPISAQTKTKTCPPAVTNPPTDAPTDAQGGPRQPKQVDSPADSEPAVGPVALGVPHLLLEPGVTSEGDEDEDECRPPSPTLVAPAPDPPKSSRAHRGKGTNEESAATNEINGRGGRREPLFLPEDDDEDANNVVAKFGEGVDATKSARAPQKKYPSYTSAPMSEATSACTRTTAHSPITGSASATTTPDSHPRDKPKSVQSVLSTSGALWNLKKAPNAETNVVRDGDRRWSAWSGNSRRSWEGRRYNNGSGQNNVGDWNTNKNWDGPLLKRPRLSDVDPHLAGGSGSARTKGVDLGESSSLNKEGGEDNEEDGRDSSSMDVDIRVDDERRTSPRVPTSMPRKRISPQEPKIGLGARSSSSQDTLPVSSGDKDTMDIDDCGPSEGRRPRSPPLRSLASVSDNMEIVDFTSTDDWDISPTLVGSRSLGHEGPGSKPKSKLSKSYGGDDGVSSITLQVNLEHIRACYVDRLSLPSPSLADPRAKTAVTQRTETAAIEQANLRNTVPDNVASAALSRIISKADFMHMDVVGQFNLGFIIVRKHVPALRFDDRNTGRQTEDDLFIVDQHAADEKWNFETLQQNTVIESQRLFRPRPLHLTAADELLALENLDVLRQNGFEVTELDSVGNAGNIDNDAVAGGGDVPDNEDAEVSTLGARLHLVAQPVSKDTVFDMKDLEELIHLMQDRPKGTMVRCSKARAMFAMRACRRSIMIGRPLDRSRMTTIVRHMGMMDQPWNCPHGRPTMRHLSDLTCFGGYDPPVRSINWLALGTDEMDGEYSDDIHEGEGED